MKNKNIILLSLIILSLILFIGTGVWVVNTHTQFLKKIFGNSKEISKDISGLFFTTYRSTDHITSLAQSDNRIIIGTDVGLYQVEIKKLFSGKQILLNEIKLNESLHRITDIQANDREIIVNTEKRTFMIKGKKIIPLKNQIPGPAQIQYNTNKYIISNMNLCLYNSQSNITYLNTGGFPVSSLALFKNTLFYGTLGGGIRAITNAYSDFQKSPRIITALLYIKGRLLIGSNEGLFYYDGKKIKKIVFTGPINNNISSMVYHKNTLYIGTFSKGLSWYNKTWKHKKFTEKHKANWVNAMTCYKDKIWIASNEGLYSIIDKGKKIHFYKGIGAPFTYIGTNTGGIIAGKPNKLYKFINGAWKRSMVSNTSILTAKTFKENLWIGGSRGLYLLSKKEKKLLSPINGTCFARWIQALVETDKGIFVGSYDRGIALYPDTDSWQMIDSTAWVNPNAMIYIKGILFVGTMDTGLWIWNGEQWYKYTTRDGLAGDDVTAFAYDGQRLWIGTRTGLSSVDLTRIN